MPRIPYTPDDISEPAALVTEMRARRGGKLLEVERMMLHSPQLATAWSGFFTGIKTNTKLSPKLRELVACTVGSVNGAAYQFTQHGAAFLTAGGTTDQLEALKNPDDAASDGARFDQIERAVLKISLEMTRNIKVSDATFDEALSAMTSHQAMVELVGVIAGYNLVSRFLVALQVGS